MPWTMKADAKAARVVFTFQGRLTESEGAESATGFSTFLAGSSNATVVWDVTHMTGYDSGARKAWQTTLWPCRTKITHVEVVGGSPLVRLGATTLGLALGIPLTLRDGSAVS